MPCTVKKQRSANRPRVSLQQFDILLIVCRNSGADAFNRTLEPEDDHYNLWSVIKLS